MSKETSVVPEATKPDSLNPSVPDDLGATAEKQDVNDPGLVPADGPMTVPLTPEMQKMTQEAAAKKMQELMLKIATQATVEWKDKDGNVIGSGTVPRGMAAVHAFLKEALDRKVQAPDDQVEVFLQVAGNKEGELGPRLGIVRGTLQEAVERMATRVVPPMACLSKLQLVLGQIAEVSSLKGFVLTMIFDDAKPIGFGMLSESSEVTDADVLMLGETAVNQAQMYKDAMVKQRGLRFPSDDRSGIIAAHAIPDNVRPNLILHK